MKRVVTGGDLLQQEMRPPDLLARYLALVESDLKAIGLEDGHGTPRPCPACSGDGSEAFGRLGFTYRACETCGTLFVSPAPDQVLLDRYHGKSSAERFWRDTLLQATTEVRVRHMVGPRAHWVTATAASRLGTDLTACDVGGRYPVLRDLLLGTPIVRELVGLPLGWDPEPGPARAFDVLVAFDAVERVLDLQRALRWYRGLLRPGGLLFVSTIASDGFEVRLLGGRMRTLVPPIHLHLLSRKGWTAVLEQCGFRLTEYSTPGGLDVQAVAEAYRADPGFALPPIIEDLVCHEDEAVRRAFQEVLQQAGLSSHVQFVAVAEG